jgi:hypothetical protein
MPCAGAAMGMPTRMLPSPRHSTASASSISVVASSSIEKARTVRMFMNACVALLLPSARESHTRRLSFRDHRA